MATALSSSLGDAEAAAGTRRAQGLQQGFQQNLAGLAATGARRHGRNGDPYGDRCRWRADAQMNPAFANLPGPISRTRRSVHVGSDLERRSGSSQGLNKLSPS